MCLHRFLEDLEAEFVEICWRDRPEKIRAESILRLRNQSKNAKTAIARCHLLSEKLERRTAELQRLELVLAERVEVYLHLSDRQNAWHYALELDRVREELADLRRQFGMQQRIRKAESAKLVNLQEEITSLRLSACH